MASTQFEDLLIRSQVTPLPRQNPLTAFVPIVVALAGVAAILFGGVSARQERGIENATVIDQITTGSIVSAPKTQNEPGHVQRWE
jgi:hypothetical protein